MPARGPKVVPFSVKEFAKTETGALWAEEILDLARVRFAEKGFAGLSMRSMASELGTSLSHLQYYYKSKEALVEATLLSSLHNNQDRLDNTMTKHANASPVDRFTAAIEMYLDLADDSKWVGFYLQLWALASSNEYAAVLSKRSMSRFRKVIAGLLKDLSGDKLDDRECTTRSGLIATQLVGLNVYFTRSQARLGDMARLREQAKQLILSIALQDVAGNSH